jgi:hypothetical protein
VHLIRLAILFLFCIQVQTTLAQDLASSYKPKNKTERLVIAKIRALSEVRDFDNYVQKDKPDFIINPPSPTFNNCYSMQIGIDYGDIFRTHFWLLINPKTFQIYYEDFDDEGMQTITIQQWRHWRKRPNFNKQHKWVNGKLVVLKDR